MSATTGVGTGISNEIPGLYNQQRYIIKPTETFTVGKEKTVYFPWNLYNKGTLKITAGADDNFGVGLPVPTMGVARIDNLLQNEGVIENNGLLIIG